MVQKILYILAILLTIVSFYKDKDKTKEALRDGLLLKLYYQQFFV